jgi:diguanylate cyclase (GGDEF)-like protein
MLGRLSIQFFVGALFAAVGVFFCRPSVAQDLQFRHFNSSDGLPSEAVYGVVQDQQGFIWTATDAGLSRFDGAEFSTVDIDSPIDAELSTIVMGPDNCLWVGYWGDGVAKINLNLVGANTHRRLGQHAWRVRAILPAQDGTTWIGTALGLQHVDKNMQALTLTNSANAISEKLLHADVWSLAQDLTGRVYVGTIDSLSFLDVASDHWASLPVHVTVRALLVDNTQRLWIGTQSGVRYLDATSTHFSAAPSELMSLADSSQMIVTALARDTAGSLWVGTSNAGLYQWDEGGWTQHTQENKRDDSLSHRNVRGLLRDASGMLWVGTRGGGLNLTDVAPPRFTALNVRAAGMQHDEVSAVTASVDGSVWLGAEEGLVRRTVGAQLMRFSLDGATIASGEKRDPNFVQSTASDSQGNVWVGTFAGLFRVAFYTSQITKVSLGDAQDHKVDVVMVDRQDQLWVATRSALWRSNKDQTGFERIASPENASNAIPWLQLIYAGDDGNIWAASDSLGLYQFNLDGQLLRRYGTVAAANSANATCADNVTAAAMVSGIWYFGGAGGLCQFNAAEQSFKRVHLDVKQTYIQSMLADQSGQLWLGLAQGLCRFEPKTEHARLFTLADGVSVHGFARGAAVALSGHQLMFGGINGLLAFDPQNIRRASDSIVKPKRFPNLALTGITLDRHNLSPFALPKVLELHDRASELDMQIAVLDFANPMANRLQWKLEGVDTTWQSGVGKVHASYRFLPPGTFALQARAADELGAFGPPQMLIHVHQRPPFWWNKWFLLLTALALFGVGYVVHRRSTAMLVKRQLLLEQKVASRTAELSEAKSNFEKLANTDELTELPNRRAFVRALKAACDSTTPVAVLIIDVDQFKSLNDQYGHAQGDECLRQIGAVIAAVSAGYRDASAARIGGEEFAVVLPNVQSANAKLLAEQLLKAVRNLRIAHARSTVIGAHQLVSISVGVATAQTASVAQASRLMSAADDALYSAKENGRNQVCLAAPNALT